MEKLNNDELNDVLQFANGLIQGVNGSGYYTPFLAQNNLLRVNNNPLKPDLQKIVDALSKQPSAECTELLNGYSDYLAVYDNIYKNTLDYYAGLLSYDLSYVCTNIKNPTELNSNEYKQDLKRLHKFLDKFDIKTNFRKVTNDLLRHGYCPVWFRDTEPIDGVLELDEIKRSEHFALQLMPIKATKITGYASNSMPLYDVDLNYFLNASVDLGLYPPKLIAKIKEAYSDVDNYKASNKNRNSMYANWCQTSPKDGAWCFAWSLGDYRTNPPFASGMKLVIQNDDLEKLALDKNILSSYYLLAGEIGMLDKTQSQKPDQFAISPQNLGKFLSLVSKGIESSGIKPIAMPLTNIKGYQYNPPSSDTTATTIKDEVSQLASGSSMIYSTEKMSTYELELAVENDYAKIEHLYDQYVAFLEYFVNKKMNKYHFQFNMSGLNRTAHKQKEIDNLMKYSTVGLTMPPSVWASALGMKPQFFERALEQAKFGNMQNNLSLLLNTNTTAQGDSEGGRPTKSNSQKSDSTESVQANK